MEQFKIMAKDIYNELGEGYSEEIYHKAFQIALRINNIDYEYKPMIPVLYKGYTVGEQEIDLLIRVPNNNLIIEVKAEIDMLEDYKAQLHRYMRLLKATSGLLINFPQCGKAKRKDYSKLYTSSDLEPEYYSVKGDN
jgi:GxxExxY protein